MSPVAPARLAFCLSLVWLGAAARPIAAQGQGGGVAPSRKADYPALRKRQQQIDQRVKNAAVSLSRWCVSKGYRDGQRRALRVALRLGGRDMMLQGTCQRLQKASTSPRTKPETAPEGYDRERAKLAAPAAPLHALWQDALKGGALSLATEVAQDLLAADPGHEATRKALGYVFHEGRWLGTRAKQLIEKGCVEDPAFGWVRKEDLPKYRQGLRPLAGKFVPKTEADKAHRDKGNPYKIVTEHFSVFSCRPLEEGVRFAKEAEELFESWCHHFAAFLAPLLGPGRLPGVDLQPPRPMRIFYFHDRAQYVAASGSQVGKGRFDVGRCCSFFYPYGLDESRVLTMIFYHEVGHQLFHAFSANRNQGMGFYRAMGGANNFLVEGLATYMEGLENIGGKLVLARLDLSLRQFQSSTGLSSTRLAVIGPLRIKLAAHYVQSKIAEPLPKLFSLSFATFPRGPRVGNRQIDRYSEAGSVVHFCMKGAGEKYRDAFGRFVRAFYEGRAARPNAIESHLNVKVDGLEAEYRDYMSKIAPIR